MNMSVAVLAASAHSHKSSYCKEFLVFAGGPLADWVMLLQQLLSLFLSGGRRNIQYCNPQNCPGLLMIGLQTS